MAQPTEAKDPAPARLTADPPRVSASITATTDQDAASVWHHPPWSSGRLVTPNPYEESVWRAYFSPLNLVILLSS